MPVEEGRQGRFRVPLGAVDIPPYSAFGRNYEIAQWSPSSFNAQPTRAAAVTDASGTVRRFDFYATTTSRYHAPVALGIWLANWETGCAALGIPCHLGVVSIVGGDLPHYDMSWIAD